MECSQVRARCAGCQPCPSVGSCPPCPLMPYLFGDVSRFSSLFFPGRDGLRHGGGGDGDGDDDHDLHPPTL